MLDPKDKGIKIHYLQKGDFVSPAELVEALSTVASTIKKAKETVSQETSGELSKLENRLNNLTEQTKRMVSSAESKTDKEIEKLTSKITVLIADIEKTFNEKVKSIKIPDISGFLSRSDYQEDRVALLKEAKDLIPEKETPQSIKEKLESLEDEERLDVSAIKGIENLATTEQLKLNYDNIRDNISRLPIGGGMIEVMENGVKVGSGTALNFTGAGVSSVVNKDGHITTITISSSGGGGTPGGSDTEIQFNDGGTFGGDPKFTWDKTIGKFTVQPIIGDGSDYFIQFGNPSDGYALTVNNNLSVGSFMGVNFSSAAITAGAWNGSPIPLEYGGTKTSLTEPLNDSVFGFDASIGASVFMEIGSGLTYNDVTGVLSASGGGTVDGSGAADRVAYWTDSNTLSYSDDFQFDGSRVFIENDLPLTFGGGAGNSTSLKTGSDGTFLFDTGANQNIKFKGGDSSGTNYMAFTDGSFNNEWAAYSNGRTIQNSGAIINEEGNDSDTRIEGDTESNLFFVDASTDRIGILTASPDSIIEVETSRTETLLNLDSNATASRSAPVMQITNETSSGVGLRIIHTDANNSQGLIRLDSPSPEIEFVETDQLGSDGSGKFEIRVNNDKFNINGRNSADSAFEESFTFERLASGGRMGIGGEQTPDAMLEIAVTSSNPYLYLSSALANDGDILSVNNAGVLAVGNWKTATTATGKIQLNSNATSPSSIDLTNTIAVGTGTGGANATNKYLGQFGWVSRDSSFTAPKLVAYIGAEATESYAADIDTGSDMVFYVGTIDGTNPTEKLRLTSTSLQPGSNDQISLGTATISYSDLFLASGGVINWANGDMTLTHSTDALTVAGGTFFAPYITSSGSNPLWTLINTNDSVSKRGFFQVTYDGIQFGYANSSSLTYDSAMYIGKAFAGGDTVIATTGTTAVTSLANLRNILDDGSGNATFTGYVAPKTNDGAALGTTSLQWSDLFLASDAVLNFNNGNATITHSSGLLTSSVDMVVPGETFGASWNGSNEVPTKNDVFDKFDSSVWEIYEEYMSGSTGSVLTGIVSGGNVTTTPVMPANDWMGLVVLATAGSANGRAGMIGTVNGTGIAQQMTFIDGITYRFRTKIRIEDLSTGSERFRVRAGFVNRPDDQTVTDGAYFNYRDDESSGQWVATTVQNSTSTGTVTATGVTVAADTDYVFEIVATTSQILYYINGSLVATHSSNIPANSTSRCFTISGGQIVKTIGTTNRQMYVDYTKFRRE